ncbi:hypothetical protein [Methylobacterium sp. V23]|uniref:hypothetical protein n=1 Tax=Methylobacterium sp. V23 TaxID=2044878 RepID=UPI000CDAF49D|nr:hypothetical protein [Methylobacterium sp. V23]POR42410.1 hypothetical protein CRT23_13180 [Methylobacterium sp. V23]
MRMFVVTFHKQVSDDTGHERRALQHQVVVPAPSSESAITAGQTLFCEANGLVDWRLRADACDAAEVQEELT